jgi:hypothetical protein
VFAFCAKAKDATRNTLREQRATNLFIQTA